MLSLRQVCELTPPPERERGVRPLAAPATTATVISDDRGLAPE